MKLTEKEELRAVEKVENMTNEFVGPPATTPEQHIARAISAGDLPKVKLVINEHPEMLHFSDEFDGNWVTSAVVAQRKEIVEWLLDQGVEVNFVPGRLGSSALSTAVIRCSNDANSLEIVKRLLASGADPNFADTRTPISALNCKEPKLRVPLLKLLVEHGVDVNKLYTLNGDKNNVFTALDWASGDCAEYLRSVGAKTSAELKAAAGVPTIEKPAGAKSAAEQVVDFFARDIGLVNARSLIEIVPEGETPISIHVIPAVKDRPFVTLFTTGLSSRKMNVPQVRNDEEVKKYLKDYEYAELYIQLPADWKYDQLDDPKVSWPIMQLRWLGKYPHANNTWLGAPATVMSRDPIEPLAPNTKFDSLLLLPDKKFKNTSGDTVQLYRLVPLYPEERELEVRTGIAPLLKALDKINTPMVVDMSRKNAGKPK